MSKSMTLDTGTMMPVGGRPWKIFKLKKKRTSLKKKRTSLKKTNFKVYR